MDGELVNTKGRRRGRRNNQWSQECNPITPNQISRQEKKKVMERDDVFWIESWFDIEKYSQPASCSKQQVEKGWHFFRFLIGMGDTATDTHLWLVPSPLPLLFLTSFLFMPPAKSPIYRFSTAPPTHCYHSHSTRMNGSPARWCG